MGNRNRHNPPHHMTYCFADGPQFGKYFKCRPFDQMCYFLHHIKKILGAQEKKDDIGKKLC